MLEEASAHYLLVPLSFLSSPGAAGTGSFLLQGLISHRPKLGPCALMAALDPSTPQTLHSQTVQPSQHRYFPLLVALRMVTQGSEPQHRGVTQHTVPTATILLPHPPTSRIVPTPWQKKDLARRRLLQRGSPGPG